MLKLQIELNKQRDRVKGIVDISAQYAKLYGKKTAKDKINRVRHMREK